MNQLIIPDYINHYLKLQNVISNIEIETKNQDNQSIEIIFKYSKFKIYTYLYNYVTNKLDDNMHGRPSEVGRDGEEEMAIEFWKNNYFRSLIFGRTDGKDDYKGKHIDAIIKFMENTANKIIEKEKEKRNKQYTETTKF